MQLFGKKSDYFPLSFLSLSLSLSVCKARFYTSLGEQMIFPQKVKKTFDKNIILLPIPPPFPHPTPSSLCSLCRILGN